MRNVFCLNLISAEEVGQVPKTGPPQFPNSRTWAEMAAKPGIACIRSTCSRRRSGIDTSSASITAIKSPRAAAIALFLQGPEPEFCSMRIRDIRGSSNFFSMKSDVPSVEASSTMMSSHSVKVCWTIELTAASMTCRSLKVGMITETTGFTRLFCESSLMIRTASTVEGLLNVIPHFIH